MIPIVSFKEIKVLFWLFFFFHQKFDIKEINRINKQILMDQKYTTEVTVWNEHH